MESVPRHSAWVNIRRKTKHMSQIRSLKVLLAILALVICTGTLQATATLVANPTSLTLNCDTLAGPTAVSVGITLAASGSAISVTPSGSAGLSSASSGPVVIPAAATVNSTTVATNFSFTIAPGCKGTVPAGTLSITFTPATGTALVVPVTVNITTSNGSALVPSPSSVTFTCNKTTTTASAAQTVSVTSAATNGTPFTIGTSPALPGWLTVSAGGLASSTPVVLTLTVTAGGGGGCAALASGTTTFNVQLLNAPAPAKTIQVNVVVGATSPLTASVTPVSITFVAGTTSSGYSADAQTTAISSSPTGLFFQVDLTTVPSWLAVSPTTGTATTAVTLSFQPAAGVAALNVGNYTANVHLKVSSYLDYVLPVSIQVNNAAPTLSILQSTTQSINWVIGSTLPTLTITPISSDAPIAFSVSTGGTLAPVTSVTQGLAYNFGSPFTVSFSPTVFASFAPGNSPTGTVTITPTGGGSAVVVSITVHVQPQSALINSIAPSVLPTASTGSFTVAITGSGFVTGSSQTVVGVVTSSPGIIVQDSNIAAVVQDSTSIVLTITVPAGNDIYLPFSGNGGSVVLGVCNPESGGTVCSTPTGTATLTIGINPIISAVTSASSYVEATAPALPTIAPYDILSIFGTNFCVSGGTGCVSPNPAVMYGATNATTYAYPTTLSPDPAGATQRNLTVTFYPHGSTTAIAAAPLLFASNGQINLIAPSALASHEASEVDIVVSFGYGTSTNLLKSQIYSVNVANTDPGIFTLNGDGEGDAAALASSYAVITQTAPAIARATAANSDTILLYVTGLGVPDSTYTGTAGSGGSGLSSTCMTAAAYWADVQAATSASPAVTSDDGLVIEPSFIPSGEMEPCFLVSGSNIPTVTIGGQAATAEWAGWVENSVAGLYQINVQLPSATAEGGFTYAPASPADTTMGATPVLLPVVVTTPANSKTSQSAGVNLWVVQGLLATVTGAGSAVGPPTSPVYTLSGAHGTALSSLAVVGTEGTGPYTYQVASNSNLPSDLTLNSDGTITGTPGSDMEGTTTVVFTVTDANGLTGNVSIIFNIT